MTKVKKVERERVPIDRRCGDLETHHDPTFCHWTMTGRHEWIPNDMYRQKFIFGLHFLQILRKLKTFKRCAGCNKIGGLWL